MSGKQPRDHECHKGHVWCDGYLEVLEHLGQREEDVAKVHEDEDEATDAGVVECIRGVDEGDGDDVVGEHLIMVLPVRFGVEDEHLVDPECRLGQVVDFYWGSEGCVRDTYPEVIEVPW